MKKQYYCISVGYPIGTIEIENYKLYQVELGGKFLGLGNPSYFIWSNCVFGEFACIVEEKFNKNYTDTDFQQELNELVDNGLVVLINTEYAEGATMNLKKFKIIRQGIGMGLKDNFNEYLILNGDKELVVDALKFDVWCQGNNLKTIEQIVLEFSQNMNLSYDDVSNQLVVAIVELVRMGLIMVVR